VSLSEPASRCLRRRRRRRNGVGEESDGCYASGLRHGGTSHQPKSILTLIVIRTAPDRRR